MFRNKVPTKQVNRLVSKYKNITTKRNPLSYKVLSSNNLYNTAHYSTSTNDSNPSIAYINSPKAPKAVGPYSQGVKANGHFYVSGCLGIVGETGEMVGETTVDQARQALTNLKYVLEEGGCTLNDVVKTTVLLTDINDFKAVNEVYSEYFSGDSKPARVCYAVKDLPKGGKVEIEAIAIYKE
ncbi:hypothetical protein ABK040_004284 [Willaertia magna]